MTVIDDDRDYGDDQPARITDPVSPEVLARIFRDTMTPDEARNTARSAVP